MLRGLRMAAKYFTIGLLAGVLLAPRKGEDTRKLLVERGKEYAQEIMDGGMRESQGMNRA
jgi:gas vesicle protein